MNNHILFLIILLLVIILSSFLVFEGFEQLQINNPKLSFIILRHVGDNNQNIFWNACYDYIRKFYKTEPIYIIDDNSKYNPTRIGKQMTNTEIINSEFPPNRGELLPYYYFHKHKFSKNTVILHDTVYIHKKIDPILLYTKNYHFLWYANHNSDKNTKKDVLEVLEKMDYKETNISLYHNKNKWDVCFGGMAILNLDYINSIFNNNNYFEVLLDEINTRHRRCCFERIISILLTKDKKTIHVNGNIHEDQKWGTTYDSYNKIKNLNTDKNMSKIWLGREG